MLQNIGVLILIALGLGWVGYRFMGFTSSTYTDNARVECQIVPVISRVQGFIKEIRFNDYTQVHKGDTLVIIEDSEFKLRLAQAEADLQNVSTGKDALNTSISTTKNNLTVSDA
jgi:membrane fusion protein (multidrug efflux system)